MLKILCLTPASGYRHTNIDDMGTHLMIWRASALALALGLSLIPAQAVATSVEWVASEERAEERPAFYRVVQSVNLSLSDHVRALPTPQMLQSDPHAARANLRAWVAEGRVMVASQRRQLADGYSEASLLPEQNAAALAQTEALVRFMDGLDILFDEFDHYSASTARLLQFEPWFVDAYYDSQQLVIRIGQELILAQARMEPDPVVASSLRVFAYSADIQLELARAGHNRAHASYLDAREMADNFDRAAADMAEALALAQAAIELAGNDEQGWGDSLNYEAQILRETLSVADDMRSRAGMSLAGRYQGLDRLVELYRNRPTRDMVFASSLVL